MYIHKDNCQSQIVEPPTCKKIQISATQCLSQQVVSRAVLALSYHSLRSLASAKWVVLDLIDGGFQRHYYQLSNMALTCIYNCIWAISSVSYSKLMWVHNSSHIGESHSTNQLFTHCSGFPLLPYHANYFQLPCIYKNQTDATLHNPVVCTSLLCRCHCAQ